MVRCMHCVSKWLINFVIYGSSADVCETAAQGASLCIMSEAEKLSDLRAVELLIYNASSSCGTRPKDREDKGRRSKRSIPSV